MSDEGIAQGATVTLERSGELYCPSCDEAYGSDLAASECPSDGTTLIHLGTAQDPLIGQVLGERYRVLRHIGQGGMGTVYQGLQQNTGRSVAIKVVEPRLTQSALAAKRFLRECTLSSRLNHPGCINVIDFAQDKSGFLFLVMELVEGQTLGEALEECGALPLDRCVDIALQVCSVLEAAHGQGIIHRDLKPNNIMLRKHGAQEQVVVLDFGLAKSLTSESLSELTVSGAIMGTPAYIAPELATGKAADERADLYALGVILYEISTGAPPFRGDAGARVLIHQHIAAPPPAPDLPDCLASVIMRLLAKDPADRFSSAADLRLILEDVRTLLPTPRVDARDGVPDGAPDGAPSEGRADTVLAYPAEGVESIPIAKSWKLRASLAAAVAVAALLFVVFARLSPTPSATSFDADARPGPERRSLAPAAEPVSAMPPESIPLVPDKEPKADFKDAQPEQTKHKKRSGKRKIEKKGDSEVPPTVTEDFLVPSPRQEDFIDIHDSDLHNAAPSGAPQPAGPL